MPFRKTLSGLGLALLLLVTACTTTHSRADVSPSQVLFVCEHGNVKSLMAATYFNEVAKAQDLPHRAVSRGLSPDSDTVPPPIVAGLKADGLDVSSFRPAALTSADIASSEYVVFIGNELPPAAAGADLWTDIPPESINYADASDAIKARITVLLGQLEEESVAD